MAGNVDVSGRILLVSRTEWDLISRFWSDYNGKATSAAPDNRLEHPCIQALSEETRQDVLACLDEFEATEVGFMILLALEDRADDGPPCP